MIISHSDMSTGEEMLAAFEDPEFSHVIRNVTVEKVGALLRTTFIFHTGFAVYEEPFPSPADRHPEV